MRSRAFLRFFGAFLLVIAVTTLTLDLIYLSAWEDAMQREIETGLVHKARMFSARVQSVGAPRLQQLDAEVAKQAAARATIIDRTGLVLADSEAEPARMENHATRPEFVAALHGGTGSDIRTSHTVGIPFLYIAVPVEGGAVRLAYPLRVVEETRREARRTLLRASAVAALLAVILSAFFAGVVGSRLNHITRFADEIAAGNLSARVGKPGFDELAHVANTLDATARRVQENFAALERSRQELEAVLNSMQEAVIAVSAEQRVLWANGQMNRLVSGGVRIGANVAESVRDPDLLLALRNTLESQEVSSTRAHVVAPGRKFAVTAAPMADRGAVAVLHDVTEIERAEKTRRDFIANVSHELRTPLTSIQGYAETVLDGGDMDDSHKREFLEIIRKNATRMARLTEDLLHLARVESGEERFQLQPIAAAELVKDAVELFHEDTKALPITLATEIATTRSVRADRDAIRQVFSNLLDNACNYGGSGNRLIIGAREVSDGVEFYVRDFGPGIASEHLPRLYERFYRVDKARSRESGGTGLGLAIVKHIVLAHGGSVRAESELNRGATFFFTLQST